MKFVIEQSAVSGNLWLIRSGARGAVWGKVKERARAFIDRGRGRSRRKKTGSPLGSHTQCRGAGGGGSGESEFGVHSVMAQFVQRSGLTSCSMRATWRATASGAGSSKQLMS